MSDTIKLATIGTSMISDDLINAVGQVEGIEYVGTLSRNAVSAREFTERHGGSRPFTSLEQLANCKDVDAVYIATPNALHYKQALACVRGDKHVLVRSPSAQTATRPSRSTPRPSSTTSWRSRPCAPSTTRPGPRSGGPAQAGPAAPRHLPLWQVLEPLRRRQGRPPHQHLRRQDGLGRPHGPRRLLHRAHGGPLWRARPHRRRSHAHLGRPHRARAGRRHRRRGRSCAATADTPARPASSSRSPTQRSTDLLPCQIEVTSVLDARRDERAPVRRGHGARPGHPRCRDHHDQQRRQRHRGSPSSRCAQQHGPRGARLREPRKRRAHRHPVGREHGPHGAASSFTDVTLDALAICDEIRHQGLIHFPADFHIE